MGNETSQSPQDRRIRNWRVEMVLGVLFVLLLVLLDARGLPHDSPDTGSYINQAHALLAGQGFAENGLGYYQPEFFRTPLYANYLALFLAIFENAGLVISLWFQRLAWGGIVLFAFPACLRQRGAWAVRLAVLGKSLALFTPPVTVNISVLMTDTLFLCLITFSFLIGFKGLANGKWGRIAVGGILLGLTSLARPAGQYIAFCLFPVCLFWGWFHHRNALPRRAILPALLFLVASLALPLGWCARNYALSGHFVLTPSTGIYLCWHRTASITRLVDRGVDFGDPADNEFAQLIRKTQNSLETELLFRAKHKMTIFDTDVIARHVGLKAITLEPVSYIVFTAYNCLGIYAAPADGQTYFGTLLGPRECLTIPLGRAVRERIWIALIAQGLLRVPSALVFLIVPVALAFWGWRTRRLDLPGYLFLAAALYFTILPSAATTMTGRFLLPILPTILYLYCVLPSESPLENITVVQK